MSSIRLVDVAKRWGEAVALERINLEIASGSFCVLLGPSGCGKSTTLRIIAGLEAATSGQVFVDGRDVTALPPAQRGVAMVFQNYALFRARGPQHALDLVLTRHVRARQCGRSCELDLGDR